MIDSWRQVIRIFRHPKEKLHKQCKLSMKEITINQSVVVVRVLLDVRTATSSFFVSFPLYS